MVIHHESIKDLAITHDHDYKSKILNLKGVGIGHCYKSKETRSSILTNL